MHFKVKDFLNKNKHLDESGASVVELVFVIPIVIIVIAGILDLSIQMSTWSATEHAATAVARTLIANPEATQDELKAAVASDAPQLKNADYTIVLDKTPISNSTYTHHFSHSDGTTDNRSSTQKSQDITVTVTSSTNYATAIGNLLSSASGSDGKCHAEAKATSTIDLTDGASW